MAGLSVILETQKGLQKCTHIIRKTSLMKNSSPSSLSLDSSSSSATSSFLENCCFCRRKLQEGNDIYMYRGDRAFCSVECRCRQIFMDEQSGWTDHCSVAAAAAAGAAGGGARAGRGRRGRAAGKGHPAVARDFAY